MIFTHNFQFLENSFINIIIIIIILITASIDIWYYYIPNIICIQFVEGDLDGDYGVDYYASDNEDGDGGGGDDDYHEPTY